MPVIKQRTQFTNSAIGVSSFDTGADAVYQAASDFANQVGRIAVAEGNRAAEKRGIERAESLTSEEVIEQSRQKPKGPLLPKIEDEKFNQVLDRRFVDTIDRDIRLESKRIAQKYEDPVSYERVFGNYLRDMTEGADERFQGVVANVAKYTMADTKLNLAAAAQRKARARLVDDLDTSNNESRERAFDSANTGDDDIAISIIESRVLATQEAEDANLPIKAGASNSVRNGLAVTAMSGMMTGLLQDVDDPIEQAAISAYVRSQGTAQAGLIDPARKARIDKYMPYVNIETASKVIASMNATNSDLNQIRVAQQQRDRAIAEQEGRMAIVAFGEQVDALEMSYSGFAMKGASSPDLSKARASYDYIAEDIQTRSNAVNQNFINGSISETQRDDQLKELRQTGVRSLVLAAASGGNISSLKAYITSGNPAELAGLSASQRTIATNLRQSALYTDDDRNYVEDLLSGSENKVRLSVEKEMRNANLSASVAELAGQFSAGVSNQEQSDAIMAQMADALRKGDINSTRYQTLVDSLGAAQGKGVINLASDVASSFDMLSLTNYIRSNGAEDAGLSDAMRLAGDQILASTPESKRTEVANHANSLREKIEKKEAIVQREAEDQQLRATVASGGGNVLNKKHREVADEVLKTVGIDITDPSSKSDEAYTMMRATPPQSLIDGLTSLSLGLETAGADVLLDHFAVLSNDPTSTGVFVNRFGAGDGAALSGAKVAFLQDVVNIRKITGQSASEIALTLNERRNDPKSDRYLDSAFGGQTAKQYVEKEYGPVIAEDLGDAAEYYARIGMDKEDIDGRLEALVDTRFTKSDLVIDPRFPMGSNNRTMHSLEAQFPNEDRRDAFVERIASQLPDGFELARSESNRARTKRYSEAGIETPPKQVYLVAHEGTSGPSYYTYFVDDNNELRPLIEDIGGELTWPMFDKTELRSYDMLKAVEASAEAESALDERQKVLDATRKRPGIRSLSDLSNISLK